MSGRFAALGAVVLGALATAALLAFAHGSVLEAPFRGDDFMALELARSAPWEAPTPRGLGVTAHASLWSSYALWGGQPVAWRLEALAWLLLGAFGWAAFTRRLLLPWTGSDHARAAGVVSGLLLLVHPLVVPVVGAVAGRGELLGFVALAWAGTSFLRGRQDRLPLPTTLAVALALLGATASRSLVLLPFLLVAVEIVSAHRYRGWKGRTRTAATTGFVFGAAVVAGWLVTSAAQADALLEWGSMGERFAPSSLGERAWRAIGEIGTLILPASPRALGAFGLISAGALFLLALQPAVQAARSAPRLWGWLLSGWLVVLFASVVLVPHAPLEAGAFDLGWGLFASVGVLVFGFAASVTAISGPLRSVLSGLLVLGFAALSFGNAQAWRPAGEATARLLAGVVDAHVEGRAVWVVDPPASVQGVRAAGRTLAWLGPELGLRTSDVRGLEARAIPYATNAHDSTPVLVAERADGWRASAGGTTRPAQRSWRDELRSPDLDLDPRGIGALVVRALADEGTHDLGPLGWRAHGGLVESGVVRGGWWRDAGELRGVMDLGSSLDWLLSGRVRRVFFESGRGRVLESTLQHALPEALAEPGGAPDGALAAMLPAAARRSLVVLAPDFELARFPHHDPSDSPYLIAPPTLPSLIVRDDPQGSPPRASVAKPRQGNDLRRIRSNPGEGTGLAVDAPRFDAHFEAPGACAWLELILDGVTIARSRCEWPPAHRP